MKLLKIFGLVLALHVVLIPLLFLSPGCQAASPRAASTAPTNEATAPAASSQAEGNWSSQSGGSSQLAPVPVGGTAPSTATLDGLTPSERARGVAPTRPDNPEAYISSTTPSVLAPTQPVTPAAPSTHTIKSGDNLVSIAKKYGTTVSAISRLNPGLKADALRPGQVIKIPASATAAPASSMPAGDAGSVASAAASSTYVVKNGDTLGAIAARNGTTVAALRKANNLRSDTLQVGQTITIPSSTRSGTTAPVTGATPAPAATPNAQPASGAPPMTVELKSGDTLGALARRYGTTVKEIMEANHITDSHKVRAGQSLIIPGFQGVGGSPVPAASTSTPRPATNTTPTTRAPASNSTPPPAPAPAPATTPPANSAPLDVPPGATDIPAVPVEGEPTPRP